MKKTFFILLAFLTLLAAMPVHAQKTYAGKDAARFKKTAFLAMQDFYASIVDAASDASTTVEYMEGMMEHSVAADGVFYPDYMMGGSKANVTSFENYVMGFQKKFAEYMEDYLVDPMALTVSVSEPKYNGAYFTEDGYGVRVELHYKIMIQSQGELLYEGSSLGTVIFPMISSRSDYHIRQVKQSVVVVDKLYRAPKEEKSRKPMVSDNPSGQKKEDIPRQSPVSPQKAASKVSKSLKKEYRPVTSITAPYQPSLDGLPAFEVVSGPMIAGNGCYVLVYAYDGGKVTLPDVGMEEYEKYVARKADAKSVSFAVDKSMAIVGFFQYDFKIKKWVEQRKPQEDGGCIRKYIGPSNTLYGYRQLSKGMDADLVVCGDYVTWSEYIFMEGYWYLLPDELLKLKQKARLVVRKDKNGAAVFYNHKNKYQKMFKNGNWY